MKRIMSTMLLTVAAMILVSCSATSEKPSPSPTPAQGTASPKDEKKSESMQLQTFTEDLGKGVKLEMVNLPGGTFQMYSSERHNLEDETPVYLITVSPFAMGKYEVTQAQWQAVMGNNPSDFKGEALPVERVSWKEAEEFCRKLSQRTGQTYRLPTDAEWEYACRAGTTGIHTFDPNTSAWHNGNSGDETHPVGQKQPNAWGLYDMRGNVWEWCQDWYQDWPNYHSQSPTGSALPHLTNPRGPRSGSRRLVRGGALNTPTFNLTIREWLRAPIAPGTRGNLVGFRVQMTAK